MDVLQEIRERVADDSLERALEDLSAKLALRSDLQDEVIGLRGRLQRANKQARRGLMSDDEAARHRAQVGYAILSLLDVIARENPSHSVPESTAGRSSVASRSVFISYSHSESEIAHALCTALRARRLRVIIDTDDLRAGEAIPDFARRSIRQCDATVAIVSTASLSSAWVIFEAVTTLDAENLDIGARLIACSLDERFLAPGFRLEITETIDRRLEEIDRLVPEYIERGLDFQDISGERTRLLRMKAALGQLLDRLRTTLTLPLRQDTVPLVADRIAARVEPLARANG
jgi:hypothetical protein